MPDEERPKEAVARVNLVFVSILRQIFQRSLVEFDLWLYITTSLLHMVLISLEQIVFHGFLCA